MHYVQYRRANQHDTEAVAAIHARSWRENYRGSYSDDFLDGDVFANRRTVWTERLARPDPSHETVVALWEGEIAGFAHTILDHDPVWGALLDNLHVTAEFKGRQVGTGLMAKSAEWVLERGQQKRLYLMVLRENVAAQAFYTARGGTCVGSEVSQSPGGTITGLRYFWPNPVILLWRKELEPHDALETTRP